MTRILAAVLLACFVGCVSVSPEQAVNISELHDGIQRILPYAEAGIKDRIVKQDSVANDPTKTQGERDEAAKEVVELSGRLMEAKILPGVSGPIRDWAIAKVGSDAFMKAKKNRDAQIGVK